MFEIDGKPVLTWKQLQSKWNLQGDPLKLFRFLRMGLPFYTPAGEKIINLDDLPCDKPQSEKDIFLYLSIQVLQVEYPHKLRDIRFDVLGGKPLPSAWLNLLSCKEDKVAKLQDLIEKRILHPDDERRLREEAKRIWKNDKLRPVASQGQFPISYTPPLNPDELKSIISESMGWVLKLEDIHKFENAHPEEFGGNIDRTRRVAAMDTSTNSDQSKEEREIPSNILQAIFRTIWPHKKLRYLAIIIISMGTLFAFVWLIFPEKSREVTFCKLFPSLCKESVPMSKQDAGDREPNPSLAQKEANPVIEQKKSDVPTQLVENAESPVGCASGELLLRDNFDSYPLGSMPTNWNAVHDSQWTSGIVTNEKSHSGRNSILLTGPKYSAITRPWLWPKTGHYAVSAWFYSTSYIPNHRIMFGQIISFDVVLRGGPTRESFVDTWPSSEEGPSGVWDINQWHYILVILNFEQKTLDFYTGTDPHQPNRVLYYIPFNPNNLEIVGVDSGYNGGTHSYVDDVALCRLK